VAVVADITEEAPAQEAVVAVQRQQLQDFL
jgi:hypothetical protein